MSRITDLEKIVTKLSEEVDKITKEYRLQMRWDANRIVCLSETLFHAENTFENRLTALEELIIEKPEAESEPEKPTAPICPTCGGEMRELKWEYYANNTSLWGKNIEMGWACPICNKKAIEDTSEGLFL